MEVKKHRRGSSSGLGLGGQSASAASSSAGAAGSGSSSAKSGSGPAPKMRVKTISRNEEEYTRERNLDIRKVFRNADPKLHPFEKAREFTRAMNAVKFDKMFSQPFLASLDGHMDSVHRIATVPTSLVHIVSGAADGEVRTWHLGERKCLWNVKGHDGFVEGIASDDKGRNFLSCGVDKTVKLWALKPNLDDEEGISPLSTYLGQYAFTGVDHHRRQPLFATASVQVDLWDPQRAEPVHSFGWGAETIRHVKFNLVETNVLVSTASDRNICLYDCRTKTPIKKIIMKMSTNAVCWNPMEAFMFSTANEDNNCYTFDMRKLDHASCIHKDHVSAVMSLDYAPTGKEFVTGSYDRTVRIFRVDEGHARDIYFTKRMQKVFAVKFSQDNKYILTGSDEMNIRIWRAQAAERVKALTPREQTALNYRAKLKQRYQHIDAVRKVVRQKNLPRGLLKAKQLRHDINKARLRKAENVRKHTRPGTVQNKPAKLTAVVKQIE